MDITGSDEKWLLLADLHIDGQRLDSIYPTLEWIVEETARVRPTHIFFAGDTTNVRKGELPALHILRQFAMKLAKHSKVHFVCGNHDLLDLHSRKISSVGLIAQEELGIYAYSEVTHKIISGQHVTLIPWIEDDSTLVPLVAEMSRRPNADKITVIGHLALRGATLSGFSHGNNSRLVCDETSKLTADDFNAFRHTFCGHYHTHATYSKATYIGSTMQHNFGDAHSAERGYILYNPGSGTWRLEVNPHAVHFIDVTPEQVLSGTLDTEKLKDKSVRLIASEGTTLHQETEARASLTQCDITSLKVVRKTRPRPAATTENAPTNPEGVVENQREFLARMVALFVAECVPIDLHVDRADVTAYITGVIAATVNDTGKTLFHADIAKVTVSDFLGFRGTTTLNFDALGRGVWMMTGNNGSGKSQLLDAIAWCLFKETFRDVSKDEVVNNEAAPGAQCSVTVTFGNGMEVHRTQKALKVTRPNGEVVQKGSMKHTQEILGQEIMNCDFDTFRRAVLLDSNDFLLLFSGGDKHRSTVLERLLGMEVLDVMYKTIESDTAVAADKEAEQSTRLMEMSPKLATLAAGIEAEEQNFEEQSNKLCDLEVGLQEEQEKARGDHTEESEVNDRLTELRLRGTAVREALDELAPVMQTAIEKRSEAVSRRTAAAQEETRARRECLALNKRIEAAQERVSSLQKLREETENELLNVEVERNMLRVRVSGEEEEGKMLRQVCDEHERALDEARTALSGHQAETILLRDQLSPEDQAEIIALTGQRTEVVDARAIQRKAVQKEVSKREGLQSALVKREKQLQKANKDCQARLESYRTRLQKFLDARGEVERIKESARCRSEKIAIPRIIDKALLHAKASGNDATVAGITEDVVKPLRDLYKVVGDRGCNALGDDGEVESKMKELTDRVSGLCIDGEPTDIVLEKLTEEARQVQERWQAAVNDISDASTQAVATATSLDTEVDDIDLRLEGLRARVQAAGMRFQAEREKQASALKADFLAIHGRKRDAKRTLVAWEIRIEGTRGFLQDAEKHLASLSTRLSSCIMDSAAAESAVHNFQDRLRVEEERIPGEAMMVDLRNQEREAEQNLTDIRELDVAARNEQRIISEDIRAAEVAMESLKRQILARRETIVRLSADAGYIKKTQARSLLDLGVMREKHEDLKTTYDGLRDELSRTETEHAVRKLWKNALASANDTVSTKSKTVMQQKGAFRRMCRKEHLSFLQSRFDENLASLNGGDYDPRLACTLTENFQFNKRNGESVAFSQRSSGEKQKTILGLLFAILESLITHGSMRPKLLVLDEVFEHLDPLNRGSVSHFLKDFTQRHPSHRVLIISHLEDGLSFTKTIRVTVSGPTRERRYTAVANGRDVDFASYPELA